MKKRILITGGSGLLGREISKVLSDAGYEVAWLSRGKSGRGRYLVFNWDLKKRKVDQACFEGAVAIIHLAGAGIADKRWTAKRKREIISSRVDSINLLFEKLPADHTIETVVSASGIGYYGAVTSQIVFSEDYPPAGDFIGRCCQLWEEALQPFKSIGIRTVNLRTAVVLSDKGGALLKLSGLVKKLAGSVLGDGRQYFPWVHIDDVAAAYLLAIENRNMQGPYNLSVTDDTTQKSFTLSLSRVFKRPLILPPVPGFALKIILGEMAVILLRGSRIDSSLIRDAGFNFRHENLPVALEELLKSP